MLPGTAQEDPGLRIEDLLGNNDIYLGRTVPTNASGSFLLPSLPPSSSFLIPSIRNYCELVSSCIRQMGTQ